MLKKLSIPISFISEHPLTKNNKLKGFLRFINWQLKSSLINKEHTTKWISNLKLSIKKGMHGATGCIYVGLPEFEDMCFALHFCSKDDIFIDIGANIGVYSILVNGIRKSETYTIEPVPDTYNSLKKNIELNDLTDIFLFNIGLSNEEGELFFTKNKDTNNHITDKENINSTKVKVSTIDNLFENKLTKPSLFKIDVEGFEYNVLKGASSILKNKNVKALIVELNGCSKRFGLEDGDVDRLLIENGFSRFDYNPFKRELNEINTYHTEKNTLYIRSCDINNIKEKLKESSPINIYNYSF